MSYRDDFSNAAGWSAADVSIRLNNSAGRGFLSFLKQSGVDTLIRYYASSARPKTITAEEAKFLSKEGFGILPVFQDSSRDISNFTRQAGKANAKSAMDFAKRVGQPKGRGSTILFAVDADYSTAEIDGPIVDYFTAVKNEIDGAFAIGAYGSGAVLSKLVAERLITVPWMSMSRLFLGTEQYFYSNRWSMRQIPPEVTHQASGVGYDRNVVRVRREELGVFQVDEAGEGLLAWDTDIDATLGGHMDAAAIEHAIGPQKRVTTEGLRLRTSPNGEIIRDLTIGENVTDLGEASEDGWRKIKAGTDEGVAFGKYLRSPGRPEVEALLTAAIGEWVRFEKGRANEASDPFYKYVREMWAAIGEPYDGRSKYPNGEEVPWSAAFISWVVRKAGPAYANFQFAASHSVFVNNAIKARVTGRQDKPYWGFRITEEKPELGDIIQRNRSGRTFSYSYAENHAEYISHSDIVVEVTPDVVRVIGGNVGDTVSFGGEIQEYELDGNGFIKPGQKVIALLKNRAGLIG
ncbi:DUF2272 domain-containing protein [Rhizobium sp. S95]|uniref:DUF2272 domain-containing protein n=1 Tax=Ciceribacter sichuanensis TaxID=2949647 RepID=A0AAJ1C166_9HYPH|nr:MULTISPECIES: DUF2272 domain-containing protein [unclassified Ciceribacter]MCM2396050.1 DUF2272 domain-containing protein [Ciceribacter sp. S95]MCO5959907.1 DUF2272 domain-containing protein [Ciceribacter sp. S101]